MLVEAYHILCLVLETYSRLRCSLLLKVRQLVTISTPFYLILSIKKIFLAVKNLFFDLGIIGESLRSHLGLIWIDFVG